MDSKEITFLEEAFSKIKGFRRIQEVAPDFQPRLQVKMKDEMPDCLKLAWDLAVFEAESNIKPCPYGGEYFTAGGRGGWYDMLFGQDTVAGGLLAFNRLYPEVMKNQIRSYVLARLNIGFMGPDGWVLENCDQAIPLHMDVWQPNSREFCERYHMSPALNRTGQDVGWLWAAGDLFDLYGDRMDWAWLYGMGNIFFDYFYKPFYDEADGLYFGQASFIDVGWNGYPFALDGLDKQTERNAAVWIKTPSCNALYVRGMDVMAHAADVLGRADAAVVWRKRADALRKAIREHLRLPDGTFAYFMHKDGRLEQRCEALGAAYCILADVVSGEDAKKALALETLRFSDAGVTLFYPFYEENPGIYHNRAAWPFASAFYYMAKEKVTGNRCVMENTRQLANAIVIPKKINANAQGAPENYQTGSFMEYVAWEENEPRGTCAQIYTISAFMNLCIRNGWLEEALPPSRFW